MYDHLAQAYVRLLRQSSPKAARYVEKIDAQYGTQAAVRAAFSLVLMMRCLRRAGQSSIVETPVWGVSCLPSQHEDIRRLYDSAQSALVTDLTARQ